MKRMKLAACFVLALGLAACFENGKNVYSSNGCVKPLKIQNTI